MSKATSREHDEPGSRPISELSNEEAGSSAPRDDEASVVVRLLRWVDRRIREPQARNSPALLIASALIFVVVTAAAVANLPDLEGPISWQYLIIVAVVAIPLTVALNATEFAMSSRATGTHVGAADALRIALVGSAANNLPIPGAATVRVAWLRSSGTTYGRAISVTLLMGLAWLGTTAVIAGVAQLTVEMSAFGLLLLGGGIAVLGIGWMVLRRLLEDTRDRVIFGVKALLVEAGFVGTIALRYLLTLKAIGIDVSLSQAVALSLSVVLASAIGIFPGGLGLRELIAAGISPLVSLPASVGLVAIALDRLVALAVMSVVTLVLAVRMRSRGGIDAALGDLAEAPASSPATEARDG